MRLPMHLAKILGGLRVGVVIDSPHLCTTRTRQRQDLSVTWPSEGHFPQVSPERSGACAGARQGPLLPRRRPFFRSRRPPVIPGFPLGTDEALLRFGSTSETSEDLQMR